MTAQTRVAVIGAGIAGLTLGYELKKKGVDVTLIESTEHPGGVLATEKVDGFELDLGPNSLVMTPALKALAADLNLTVVEAGAVSRNRYLVRNKTLHAISPHPIKLLQSSYLSWSAKARILTERFRPKGPPGEQSIAAFFRRRFGPEITASMADPIFSGIYAGDIDKLSLDQLLPVLPKWEQEYGSLTKGLLHNKGALKAGRQMVNFQGGMQSLVDALSVRLTGQILSTSRVTQINEAGKRFSLNILRNGQESTLSADRLVFAAPLHAMRGIGWFEGLQEQATSVDYVPVQTLHLAIPRETLSLPPGFGFLVPSQEGLSLMGCIFASSIFPGKAPEGFELLTVMLGGAHRRTKLLSDPEALKASALAELREILGIRVAPRVLLAHTWTRAIPQKNLGYGDILQSLKAFEGAHSGFRFVGNAFSGVSVGDTMAYASKVGEEIYRFL